MKPEVLQMLENNFTIFKLCKSTVMCQFLLRLSVFDLD